MVGIYRIKNIVNGKCYYGSSKDVQKRWRRHEEDLTNNRHHSVPLQRAWNKYGSGSFIFEVVEECIESALLEVEQKYLNNNPEYNVGKSSSGGDNLTRNPNKRRIIQKIKDGTKKWRNSLTEEQRKDRFSKPLEKNPNWKGGRTYCNCGARKDLNATTCAECRDRSGIKNPFYGKKHTEESKQLMRERAKNRIKKPANSKKVLVEGVMYETATAAAKAYNITRALVNYRCASEKYNWQFVTI